MAGCRCLPCRAANSRYETNRFRLRRLRGWNGLVDASKSRNHILKLSRVGVGYKSVAFHSGISITVTYKIKSGKRKQIRAMTEKAILGVTALDKRGSTLIPAAKTWKKIQWLLSEGFTKQRIARELGSTAKQPALQLNRRFVTVYKARKIEALWNKYRK